jgi:hypothetical protein
MMVADRQELVERDDDHAIRKRPTNGIDHFEAKADEVMEVNDVGSQVPEDAEKVALDLLGVPVRNEEVIVLVGMIEELALGLPKAHQGRSAVPRHRVADASEESRLDVADPVQALVQVVGGDLGASEREARMAMRDDEYAGRVM